MSFSSVWAGRGQKITLRADPLNPEGGVPRTANAVRIGKTALLEEQCHFGSEASVDRDERPIRDRGAATRQSRDSSQQERRDLRTADALLAGLEFGPFERFPELRFGDRDILGTGLRQDRSTSTHANVSGEGRCRLGGSFHSGGNGKSPRRANVKLGEGVGAVTEYRYAEGFEKF